MNNFENTGEALPEFYIGKMVKVKRSSGEIEEGWQVGNTEAGPGRITVTKDGIRKSPKVEDLREWNS